MGRDVNADSMVETDWSCIPGKGRMENGDGVGLEKVGET